MSHRELLFLPAENTPCLYWIISAGCHATEFPDQLAIIGGLSAGWIGRKRFIKCDPLSCWRGTKGPPWQLFKPLLYYS